MKFAHTVTWIIAILAMQLGMGIQRRSDAFAAEPAIEFSTSSDRIAIRIDGVEVAQYWHDSAQTSRPFFADVKTLSGHQVTRNYPPQKDVDLPDHADMHPGIWMSFGDINGQDYWRLKSPTNFQRFLVDPHVASGVGSFTVENHYLTSDQSTVVCTEINSISVRLFEHGYILGWESEFQASHGEIHFGDQEEMGIGIRVASQLAVDAGKGGRILDSHGRKNGEQVWGKLAQWCDYAGPLDNAWAGMTIFCSPNNFHDSWCHARNYGFLAMNPFGVNAFTQAPRQDIRIEPGKNLKLAFAIAVHETSLESGYDPTKTFLTVYPSGDK